MNSNGASFSSTQSRTSVPMMSSSFAPKSSGLPSRQYTSLQSQIYQKQSAPRRSGLTTLSMGIGNVFGMGSEYPLKADENMMKQKAHGTSENPVQDNLLYGCDSKTADKICSFNRHYAEFSGYAFSRGMTWIEEIKANPEPRIYYDSVTGYPLFKAPIGRSVDDFIKESQVHGWPSFRDEEVIWDRVRCLGNGECIAVDGTHLGHNLPDFNGNRYCINLVCIAGTPSENEDQNHDGENSDK